MRRETIGKILKVSALVIDVGAPLVATVTQFPIWVDRSAGATMSGLFVFFALLSAIPFFKQIKAYFKSPSAWVMWTVIFVVFVVLRSIIDEMLIICAVGMVGNMIGAGIHKLGVYFDPPRLTGGGNGQNGGNN